MRKIIVAEFVSLDGVMLNEEMVVPHRDPVSSAAVQKQMNMPFDLLLGRRTFDMWARYWPQHND
ncbi:MAG: hypothetical protein WAM91_11305, partial [Candidatus Acidiferrales bacterium]